MFCHQMEAIQLRLCQQGPNLMKHLMMILTPATTPPLLSPAHVTPGGILYRSIKEDGAYFIGYSYITCRNQFWVESCSTQLHSGPPTEGQWWRNIARYAIIYQSMGCGQRLEGQEFGDMWLKVGDEETWGRDMRLNLNEQTLRYVLPCK